VVGAGASKYPVTPKNIGLGNSSHRSGSSLPCYSDDIYLFDAPAVLAVLRSMELLCSGMMSCDGLSSLESSLVIGGCLGIDWTRSAMSKI
jgi:hypothetical protein